MHERAFLKRIKNAWVVFLMCIIFQMIKQCVTKIIFPRNSMCFKGFLYNFVCVLFVCLFGVFRPTREFFTHLETFVYILYIIYYSMHITYVY